MTGFSSYQNSINHSDLQSVTVTMYMCSCHHATIIRVGLETATILMQDLAKFELFFPILVIICLLGVDCFNNMAHQCSAFHQLLLIPKCWSFFEPTKKKVSLLAATLPHEKGN